MELQTINALNELNFNNLFTINTDTNDYSYEQYIKNGLKHPLSGMCVFCEENGVNECPSDKIFKLKSMGHGTTGNDIILAAGQRELDLSSWKKQGVMFVLENPGSCSSNIYNEINYKGYYKFPTYRWFWTHKPFKKCEYPENFQGRKYDEFIASVMFTFKLKSLYITDIVKCGMNDKPDGKNKTIAEYNQKCIDNCLRNYFYKEIQIVKPRIIFCLSRKAEKILNTKKSKIEQLSSHQVIIRYLPHPNSRLSNNEFQSKYYKGIIYGLFDAEIISDIEKDIYLTSVTDNNDKDSLSRKSVITKGTSKTNKDNLRSKLIGLKEHLGKGLKDIKINITCTEKKNIISTKQVNGTFAYISLSRSGFTFHWEARRYYNETWFNERKDNISKIFPDSYITKGGEKGKPVYRLWIPVDQENYLNNILDIIQKTKSIMDYSF